MKRLLSAFAMLFGALAGGTAGSVPAFQKGCTSKNGSACENLGTALANGWGSTADPSRAFGYQQDACDLGSFNGCYNLANYYFAGVGTPKDPVRRPPP